MEDAVKQPVEPLPAIWQGKASSFNGFTCNNGHDGQTTSAVGIGLFRHTLPPYGGFEGVKKRVFQVSKNSLAATGKPLPMAEIKKKPLTTYPPFVLSFKRHLDTVTGAIHRQTDVDGTHSPVDNMQSRVT